MSRYYSESNDTYYGSRQQSDNVRASGWQSPLPTTDITPLSSIIRIVVECPFGSKKCDYTIDKSQRGRLIITARRRHIFSSDYLSLNNKNNQAIQTFTIPYDADVDHLQSYIERHTNRLIIEIPRLHSSYMNANNTYTNLIRSSDMLRPVTSASDDTKYSNRKLEYRIDCRGYTADELDVFIKDRDLIVEGKTNRAMSSDPTQQRVSKEINRKISLPDTVDLSKVISYFENGELRIEAPFKRGIYYNDKEISSPRLTQTRISNRTPVEFDRVQSPIPANHRRHYRRRERVSRRQPTSPMQRVQSAEGLRYSLYGSPRDFVENDNEDNAREAQRRRTVNYERYFTDRNDTEQQPIYRSIYSPINNDITTRTTYRRYPIDKNEYFGN